MRASAVVFEVTFSEAVTNVGTDSFAIVPVNGGNTDASVASVSGGPIVYQVTVNITGGAGDFRLDVGPAAQTFATGFGNPNAIAFDQTGNLYVADDDYNLVRKVTVGGVVSTFATGISSPYGLVFSAAGDLYVASNSEVKKVTSSGVVTTFATGFSVAGGMAFDSAGNLYVGNYGNSTISKVTSGGVVSTFVTDINAPFGLTFDSAGNLYAASRDASTISKITSDGTVSTFATGFSGPHELEFDGAGNLFVADRWAGRVAKVTPDGTVSTYATGLGAPYGLAFDSTGALYVSSYYVDRVIRKITLPVIDDLGGNSVPRLPYTQGEIYTYDPNDAPTDIQLSNASLAQPVMTGAMIGTLSSTDADAADTHTYSLVSGTGDTNNNLFAIDGSSLRLGASVPAAGYYSVCVQTDDGQGGTYAKAFTIAVGIPQIMAITRKSPSAQAVAADAVVFEVIFSQAVTGVVSDDFAVTALNGASVVAAVSSVNGGPTVYEVTVGVSSGTGDFRLDAIIVPPVITRFATGFNNPSALAVDGTGTLFVANFYAGTVSKVSSDGSATTFASGFNGPDGLAFDSLGNLYVANNRSGRISKVSGDGSAATFASGFNGPYGLAFDSLGNLYVANNDDNTVSKVAGDGSVHIFATGFNGPTALAFNAAGDLFVGNEWNNSVSKVTSDGNAAFFSDGFNGAEGLAFDEAGSLYVANNWNSTLSKVTRGFVFSTFTSAIDSPAALAFDSAGNLYVGGQNDGTITRLAIPASIRDLSGTELIGLPYVSGESYTRVLNSAPTDLTLSGSTAYQSAGVNATVGSLTTTDADSGDAHTYTLVAGAGDTDNASFNLSGSTLRANNSTALAAGNYSVRIRTDDGVSDPYEKTFTLTVVDDLAPAAPATPDLATASDNGISSTDNLTGITTPTFTGTAEAGATVELFRNGSISLGAVVVDGSGNWTLTVGTALGAGTYSITAKARDAANNLSTASTALSITIVSAAASVTSPPHLSPASDSGSSSVDGITTITTPTFTGTGEAGSTVELFRSGSISLGSTVVDGSGNWSITVTTALGDGIYSLTAKATDIAGQTGAASTALSLTIDVTASAAPVITAISRDTGVSDSDQITSDNTLVISGISAAGELVTVFRNSAQIGTTTADGGGAWSFDYTGTTLANGVHTFTAKSTDLAGNLSDESTAFLVEIDLSTPAAPLIVAIANDSGASASDGITRNATLILSGTAEAASIVTISQNLVGVIGSVTVDGSGAWSFDYSGTTLPDGDYVFTAFASDKAGNVSAVSADFPVTIDTAAPTITAQPAGGIYDATDAFTLSVTALDSSALSYQWYRDATPLTNDSDWSGSTTASLTHASNGNILPGDYNVRIIDLAGNSVTSEVATIATKADQTIQFSPVGPVTPGTPVTLSGTASSGLLVTFAVVSGNGTISGVTFTAHDANPITLRASQAGNASYRPATADQVVSNIAKVTQTITFAALSDRLIHAAPFLLNASSTSALAIEFTVLSGPAAVHGGTVTLTGQPGIVTIVAHQAGDAVFSAAPDVTRSFVVMPDYPAPASDGFAGSTSGGAGSQQVAVTSAAEFISQVNASVPSVITVVGTINLGSNAVPVLSNKTIQGVDGNATLVGNLNVAGDVTNVVIRGLNFTNPGTIVASGVRQETIHALSLADSSMVQSGSVTAGGAAVTIAGAHNVFVTRCSFFDCADYAVKITNGADNIAISWSEFGSTSSSGADRGAVLIGSAGAETSPLHVSLHHNLWSAGIDQGMPAATYGYVHLYNNYFNTPGNTSGTAALDQSQILSERNVYAGVNDPLTRRSVNPALPIGRIFSIGNLYTATTGMSPYAGTDTVFTPSYSYEALPVSDVTAMVTAHAGNVTGANYAELEAGSATLTGPDASVVRGANFSITVTPHGVTPSTYQWRRSNRDIPNATAASYSVINAQDDSAGTYTVALGLDSEDMVVSSPLVVTLATDPVVVAPTSPPAGSNSGGGAMSGWFMGGLTVLVLLRLCCNHAKNFCKTSRRPV